MPFSPFTPHSHFPPLFFLITRISTSYEANKHYDHTAEQGGTSATDCPKAESGAQGWVWAQPPPHPSLFK